MSAIVPCKVGDVPGSKEAKHSCRVEGSFWLVYFVCRRCGAVRSIDRDALHQLLTNVAAEPTA